MKINLKKYLLLLLLAAMGLPLSSFLYEDIAVQKPVSMPYKAAGLTEKQAAAHLLGRFTYGATPGQVDEVTKTGLLKWFKKQLESRAGDDSLKQLLAGYDLLGYSNQKVSETFPRGGQLVRMAIAEGVINKDSVNKQNNKEYRSKLDSFMSAKGMKPERELFRQFINQKIYRAAYTENQLQEVLTDFWFNHFNVSITKNDCARFIPAYERDVIRPNALGKFEELLLATAKSPAMLLYLDNFSSSGVNSDMDNNGGPFKKRVAQKKKGQGLNENYAREVMELHTLGVDGGYTQQDVTQAAGVLTGWTIYPMGEYGRTGAIQKLLDRVGEDKLAERGFVREGDFLFTPNRHDNSDKVVLGKTFKGSGGYQEGVELLKMLAHHASTAKFISGKLAVRFVSDNPPASLINKMATTFLNKNGDIKEVLITMVSSPEFWSKEALREKTKSPFELTMSAVRSLRATIVQPYQLFTWLDKMGQKMYFYQAPTGFPDKGTYWINTGSLLNRMNFGLALAQQRIPGVKVNLIALNEGHEPESTQAALATYSALLMPERDLTETIKRLTPLLNDPELEKKINAAAGKSDEPREKRDMQMEGNASQAMMDNNDMMTDTAEKERASVSRQLALAKNDKYMLTQVVGIIIGSPEFQRR